MSRGSKPQGKRAGSRKGAKQRRGFSGRTALWALAVTLFVVAWGYLVWLAIDFGSSARGGDNQAWWLLLLACVGAAACLFIGLLLCMRLIRSLSEGTTPTTHTPGRRIKV